MTKILSLFTVLALVVIPNLAFGAQGIADGVTGADNELGGFISSIINFINEVVIPFILAIGFLVFIWGVFQFFILGGSNDEAKESGKSLIMYAIAGFVIILSFWGIINLVTNGIGFGGDQLQETPQANGI